MSKTSVRVRAAAALAAGLCGAAHAADPPPVAPQPLEPVTVVTGKDGLWLLGNATGRLRYCVALREGTGGTFVRGTCATTGTLSSSATGYEARGVGVDLYVVNKATGAVQLCSPSADKTFVRINCQPIATLDRLPEPKKP